MFNYELAKKLKDAGFPQNIREKIEPLTVDVSNVGEIFDEAVGILKGDTLVPTLEELIEACGENIILWKCEEKYGGHWHAGNGVDKMRECKIVDASYFDVSSGKTPTEAVANLWLSLHTK